MAAPRPSTAVVVMALLIAVATTGFTPGIAAASPPAGASAADTAAGTLLALDADAYRATRGGLVPLVVTVDAGEGITLTVSDSADLYESTAVLVDADGDGRIRVTFDSARAGHGDESLAYRVAGDDRLATVTRATDPLDGPLPAGRYQLVATTGVEWDGAQLRLDPFSFGAASAETLPNEDFADHADGDSDLGALVANATPTAAVARGDPLVLRFDAPGTSGLLVESQPATNLVAADPSTPGVRATHTVRVPVSEAGPLRGLTVDYDGTPAERPRPPTSGPTVSLVAVDSDGDGFADDVLSDRFVSAVSHSDGRYRFQFDGQYELAAGDTLIVAYDLVNPDAEGYDYLHVRLNDAEIQTGVVAYGLAGSGSLGNGVDLAVVATGDTEADEPDGPAAASGEPVSLAGAHYAVDAETGVLTVVVPTAALAGDEPVAYRATLGLTDASPYAADVRGETATVAFSVVPRTASIDRPATGDGEDSRFTVAQARETVSGTTSLAPGSRVVVSASRFDDPGSFIQVRLATVADDGTWAATFDFRDVDPGSTVQLAVYDWERGQPVPSAALTDPVEATVVDRDR